MAERDKVIKSGQLTLPRILFLVLVGGVIVFTVYAGGIFLTIGYWLLTLSICALLLLIAMDYGVTMDKVSLSGQPAAAVEGADIIASASEIKTSLGQGAPASSAPKVKRKASRQAKRRR